MRKLLLILACLSTLSAQTYPGAVYTPLLAKDNIATTLTAPMLVGDVTATVSSGTGWAANMVAYICDGGTSIGGKCTGTFEAMKVTNVVGNVLTVTRGFGGTSAVAHTSGRTISNAVAAVYNTSSTAEIVAIETALGPNLSNVTGYRASAYNFTPQAPGGTLSAGAQSITLTPCPYGVAGTFTTSYLYLLGGTGTAEAVPIIGGTCTSGAATGTVIVTVANSHSGAWTVSSASGGIQEAYNSLPGGTGTVILNPSGTIQSHAKITIPSGRNTIDGQNLYNYALQRAADYPNGNLLEFPVGAISTIQNMWIKNDTVAAQTSGAAVHFNMQGNATITNVNVVGGYIGYDFDGTYQIQWTNSGYNAAASTTWAGAWIHDSSNGTSCNGATCTPVNTVFNGGTFSLNATSRGLLIYAADIAQFNNIAFGGGTIQTYLSRSGTSTYIAAVKFSNCAWDNAATTPIKLDGTGTFTNFSVIGGEIHGDGNNTNNYGIDLGFSNTIALTHWVVSGVSILNMGLSGIAVGAGASEGSISGGILQGNDTTNNASEGGIKLAAGVSNLTVSGVTITNTNAIITGHQSYAVGTIGAASGITIAGNGLCGNTAPLSIGGALTNSVITGNACLNSGMTFINLPANMPNGTTIYVTDSNSTCTAGSSSGQLCKRVAGAWTN